MAGVQEITSFEPPRRVLMGPGPSDVHQRVLDAMARPTIGHLDPEFVRMMDELKELLRYAFQTENRVTFPVSGPGSVGMETCFVNLVEPGDKVLVCRNGAFGGRQLENVERTGGVPVVVDDDWGTPVSLDKARGRARREPGRQDRLVRPRGDVHRRRQQRRGDRGDGPRARRARHRRHRHLARRHPGDGRRVGARRRLLGQPEVPELHAGPLAGHLR